MAAFEEAAKAGLRARLPAFDELQRTTAGALAATDRPLGTLGHFAVWGNLGAGLYLLVIGAWLAPALSIPRAVAATLIGAALGSALVALLAWLGARENRPAVVLHRGALGEAGATIYGAFAIFRHLAWGALQIAIAAELAAAVFERQGMAGGRPLWAAVFAAVVLLMTLAGPATVARRWLAPTMVLTLLVAAVFTYSAWSNYGIPGMLTREPSGGWPSTTAAVDLVALACLAWLPVAADLGRLGKPGRAGIAVFGGLGVMTAWFVLIGMLFLPLVDGRDLAGFLLSTPLGLLAILLIIVLELDGAFVSLYGLASTARGWAPKLDATLPAVVAGAAVFALGGALLDPFGFGDVLLLLGAGFAPLLGVLLAARLTRRWAGAARPPAGGGIAGWAIGFLLYNWASPLDVPAWTPAMELFLHGLLRLPFPAEIPGLSAVALGFVAAAATTAAAAALPARRPASAEV